MTPTQTEPHVGAPHIPTTAKTSRDARMPASFTGLTMANLKPVPMQCGDLAVALTKEGAGVKVELLSHEGVQKIWHLTGVANPLRGEQFVIGNVRGHAAASGSTLTLDVISSNALMRTLHEFIRSVQPALTADTAHLCIRLDTNREDELRVIVSLNSETPWSVRL